MSAEDLSAHILDFAFNTMSDPLTMNSGHSHLTNPALAIKRASCRQEEVGGALSTDMLEIFVKADVAQLRVSGVAQTKPRYATQYPPCRKQIRNDAIHYVMGLNNPSKQADNHRIGRIIVLWRLR